MSVPRVLLVGDHGVPTGFERVVRGIGLHLQATGRFSVVGRGVSYVEGQTHFDYPWPVKLTSTDPVNILGTENLAAWVAEDQPDVVLFVNDLWNIATWMGHARLTVPVVAYYPVDTPNLKGEFGAIVGGIAQPVTYTQFGALESALSVQSFTDRLARAAIDKSAPIKTLDVPSGGMSFRLRSDWLCAAQRPEHYAVIPHGLDHAEFSALESRADARAYYGIPEQAFVVTNVNTNQFRKRLDTTMRTFAHVAKKRSDALLVLHCAGGDRNGWDLQQLAHYYGVTDRVRLVHTKQPFLTDEALRRLYRVADININTAGGEGWGLNSMHSAACGVPQAVVAWVASDEIWADDEAVKFRAVDYRHEPRGLNTCHALISAREAAVQLLEFSESPALRSHLVEASARVVARQWSWDAVGAAFADKIDAALAMPEPVGRSLNDWWEARGAPLTRVVDAF